MSTTSRKARPQMRHHVIDSTGHIAMTYVRREEARWLAKRHGWKVRSVTFASWCAAPPAALTPRAGEVGTT